MNIIYLVNSNGSGVRARLTIDSATSSVTPALVAREENPRDTAGRCLIVSGSGGDLHVKIASERAELRQAFELLANHYRPRPNSDTGGEFGWGVWSHGFP